MKPYDSLDEPVAIHVPRRVWGMLVAAAFRYTEAKRNSTRAEMSEAGLNFVRHGLSNKGARPVSPEPVPAVDILGPPIVADAPGAETLPGRPIFFTGPPPIDDGPCPKCGTGGCDHEPDCAAMLYVAQRATGPIPHECGPGCGHGAGLMPKGDGK